MSPLVGDRKFMNCSHYNVISMQMHLCKYSLGKIWTDKSFKLWYENSLDCWFFFEYAVFKAQTSLAPLSRFRGSRITTAHEQQCCRFQSYAKTVPSQMKLTSEIDKAWTTFLGSTTTDHGVWRLTLTAYRSKLKVCFSETRLTLY